MKRDLYMLLPVLATWASTAFAGAKHATCPPYCVAIPEKSPEVTACEQKDTYTIDLPGEHLEFDKEAFRSDVRQAVQRWLAKVGVFPPLQAGVEFWLAVPDIEAANTQARVVVHLERADIVIFLPLHPEQWPQLTPLVSVVDAQSGYPKSYGYQAEELLLTTTAEASEEAVQALLTDHGATLTQPLLAGDTALVHVGALQERQVANSVLADPRAPRQIKYLVTNSIMEWLATRERAFAFSLSGP